MSFFDRIIDVAENRIGLLDNAQEKAYAKNILEDFKRERPILEKLGEARLLEAVSALALGNNEKTIEVFQEAFDAELENEADKLIDGVNESAEKIHADTVAQAEMKAAAMRFVWSLTVNSARLLLPLIAV